MITKKFNLLTVSIFAASLFVSLDIYAQQSEASNSRLEEVVVTAQKKEEGLSEVPISIAVLSDEMIESRGITSMKHLSEYIPGLHISKGAGEWNVYMRGMGSGTNKGFSQSITTIIDGMPVNQGSQYSSPLMDVERVEVLRGTQGVLFGKNTIGGVINIVSKSPVIGGEQDGNWKMEFVPEWGTQKYSGAMNIPVNDSFAMRVAVQKEMSDGWTKNDYLGTGSSPETESEAIRATMLWEMDNLEVNLKLSTLNTVKKGSEAGIYKYELSAPFGALATATPPYTGTVINWRITNAFFQDQVVGVPGVTYSDNTTYQNPTGGNVDSDNAILKLSSSWKDHDVVSTTTYSEYVYKWGLDADFGPLSLIAVDNDVDFRSMSHEVTVSSPADDTFEYIFGIYVDDIHYDGINDGMFDMSVGGLFGQVFTLPNIFALQTKGAFSADFAATHTSNDQNSKSRSIFAEGTYYVNDKLTVKAGVRLSKDDKDVKSIQGMSSSSTPGGLGRENFTLAPPVLGVFNALVSRKPHNFPIQTRSESHTTPSFKVLYDYSDNTRLYMSIAEGYKMGGFDGSENAPQINSTTPGPAFQFENESAETIEIGAKMEYPERSLRGSIAYFSTDYTDMQVSIFNGSSFQVSNAGDSEIDGIEAEFTWAPTDNLVIGGSATTLDMAYGQYIGGCTADQEVAYRLANNTKIGCVQNQAGQPGNNAPELAASMYANYYQNLDADWDMVLSMTANYQDEVYTNTDNDPDAFQEAYTKINISASVQHSNGFEVSVFARNLTDEVTATQLLDLPLVPGSHFALWAPGKEVGISFRGTF
jgi:outer membrane receptor protein involved in Fe transport